MKLLYRLFVLGLVAGTLAGCCGKTVVKESPQPVVVEEHHHHY